MRGALVSLDDACARRSSPAIRIRRRCGGCWPSCSRRRALLASTLKFNGSLIVQLQGDGPVRLLVVECNDALDLRATAQWDDERATRSARRRDARGARRRRRDAAAS